MVLAVLIVEDLFAVVMMVILSSIAINNSVEGTQLLLSVGKLVFFLVMWFLVGVYVLPSMFNAFRRFLNSETLLVISMGLCLGMAVFCTLLGHSVFSWGLKYLPPAFISTACLLEPVLASVWGLLLFRERPGLQVMLGGALILLGIGLYSREEEQR